MKYSWKYILLWMMAVALVGCSKESYPGLEYAPSIPESLVNHESGRSTGRGLPVMMSVSGSTFQTTPITRGTGPFDDVSNDARFRNSTFYLFAFRDNPDERGVLAYTPSFTQRSTGDNPDCLIDGNNYLMGMPAQIDNTTGVFHMKRDNGVDTLLYYGARHQDNGYNFFAYYLDSDFVPSSDNAHRDESGIYYDIELDGTQDIMTGHSLKMTEQMLIDNYPVYSELTQEQRNHILNIGNFSAYSAIYEINPILYMRHLLTQLKFYAYPADRSAVDIEFTEIQVEARYQGRLYVVRMDVDDLDFTYDESRKFITLKERSEDDIDECLPYQPLTPSRYKVQWDDTMTSADWTQNPAVHIGDDMMLPPDATFHLKVVYTQKIHTSPDLYRDVEAEYLLKAPELEESIDPVTGEYSFLPSKTYAVKMGIFGGRTPEVVVGLEGWQDGGDIDVAGDPTETGNE